MSEWVSVCNGPSACVGDDVHQVTRTVTTWPDGTALIGPWQPAEVASDG